MKFNVPSKTLYNYVSSVSKVINSNLTLKILLPHEFLSLMQLAKEDFVLMLVVW